MRREALIALVSSMASIGTAAGQGSPGGDTNRDGLAPEERTRMRPEQMFRLAREHHAGVHAAISAHLVLPADLAPGERCRIDLVQTGDGATRAVEIVECRSRRLEAAVRDAIARSTLPPPPRFPQDPLTPMTATLTLEFGAPE